MTEGRPRQILNSDPKGAAEGMQALREMMTGEPEKHEVVEGSFSEVKHGDQNGFENQNAAQSESEEPESAMSLHEENDEMILSPGEEQEKTLNTLPEKQQAQLNSFSRELVDKFADGASSLVDQDVMGMLQRLPKAGQEKWWKLMLSGREGWKALAAQSKEIAAGAKLRNSIADTAITLANLGEEEMEREVFISFISTLRNSMGETGIQTFCNEHGLDMPEEGTVGEKMLLLRIHSANLGLARYREAIRDQMVRYTKERAKLEGETAMSRMRAELLPALIEAKKEENPLKQREMFQKAGHAGSMVAGTPVAFVSGAVGGVLSGAFYGFEHGWLTTRNIFKGRADWTKNTIQNLFKKTVRRTS